MILAAALAMATQSVAEMRDRRRVLIVAVPASDPARERQDATLRTDAASLAERDVTIVHVTGSRVEGARDTAATLRSRWKLSPEFFTVLLIGKDGREALRRATPIDAATLIAAIDAMPMRRAGLR